MILLKSYQIHASDVKNEKSLCGHVTNQTGEEVKGHYLDVDCKLCQWIMNNQLTFINQKI